MFSTTMVGKFIHRIYVLKVIGELCPGPKPPALMNIIKCSEEAGLSIF